MRSDTSTAAVKALALLKLWNFPNSYTLGKRFTELLVNNKGKRFTELLVNNNLWLKL